MKFDRCDAGRRAGVARQPHHKRATTHHVHASAWIVALTRRAQEKPHEMRLSSSLQRAAQATMVVTRMDTYKGTSALPDTGISPTRTPRILVIEDDRFVRMLLCDLLEAWGYEPNVAADGREGLALFSPGRYDAVLTDLGMPGRHGVDTVARLREQDTEVSVIMFTAFTGDLDADGRRLGFTILRKPLDIEGLRRAIRAAIEARGTMAG
ncbi:MAG TPA: response regulator [Methylomirabilota bacterium]|nr:response regulator [Methylomirabilota bacterium]